MVTVCSFAGVAGYAPRLDFPVAVAVLSALPMVIGSQVGARLVLRGATPSWITRGYVVILVGVAIKLVWEASTSVFS